MKKLFLIFTVLSYASSIQAQSNPFENGERVTWLGVDFSHVKLIGEFSEFSGAGEKSPRQIRDQYFESWNMVPINEQEKYDFSEMIGGNDIYYDFEMVFALNEKTNIEELKSYNEPHYSKEDIIGFTKSYDFVDKNGIGIVFIAETLNKSKVRAIYHFVIIDMGTKTLMDYKTVTAKPGGFTLRNYWAGSIHNAIKIIGKDY